MQQKAFRIERRERKPKGRGGKRKGNQINSVCVSKHEREENLGDHKQR